MTTASCNVKLLGKERFDLFSFKGGGKAYLQGLEAGPRLISKFMHDLGQDCQFLDVEYPKSENYYFSIIDLIDVKGKYETRRQQPFYTINNQLSPVKFEWKLNGQEASRSPETPETSETSERPKAPKKLRIRNTLETPTPRRTESPSSSDLKLEPDTKSASNVLIIDDPEGDLLPEMEAAGLKIPEGSAFVFYQTRCPEKSVSDQNSTLVKIFNDQSLKEFFIVVDVEDLRKTGASISRNLSWESAAADTVKYFREQGFLQPFIREKPTKPTWIVRFGDAGAIVLRDEMNGSNPIFRLYFDPKTGEGDISRHHTPNPVALNAAFLSGIAFRKITECNRQANGEWKSLIEAGLFCVRYLATQGTVRASKSKCSIVYPKLTLGDDILLQESEIPNTNADKWTILKATHRAETEDEHSFNNLVNLGIKIANDGLDKALPLIPIVRFGDYVTADRFEIEHLHRISNRMEEYLKEAENFYTLPDGEKEDLNTTRKKPLSIGVFGAPGSGKSFVIEQIIQGITEKTRQGKTNKYPDLYWNLSQFLDYSNLLVAFQTVRDKTLSGQVPIVCFDEFDTTLNGELGWLKFFLAPMQDGKFFDQGQSRPIGHAIFIFIGGTRFTFEDFQHDRIQLVDAGSVDNPEPAPGNLERRDSYSLHQEEKAQRAARAVKLPDFVSRLNSHLDIQGYGKDSDKDPVYIIRRAILIRSKLKKVGSKLKGAELAETEVPKLDDATLKNLLLAKKYEHGARSIDNIFKECKITDQKLHLHATLPEQDLLPEQNSLPEQGSSPQKTSGGVHLHKRLPGGVHLLKRLPRKIRLLMMLSRKFHHMSFQRKLFSRVIKFSYIRMRVNP
ncbi:hypothetical protein N7523_008812 [Penicillium sp. IBT 18751x]|nr:hypothetical protein N7523_008812 [Penicillium sp. IBT 18751x]